MYHKNNSENLYFTKNPPQIWKGQWQVGNTVIEGRLNFAMYELFLQHRYGAIPTTPS